MPLTTADVSTSFNKSGRTHVDTSSAHKMLPEKATWKMMLLGSEQPIGNGTGRISNHIWERWPRSFPVRNQTIFAYVFNVRPTASHPICPFQFLSNLNSIHSRWLHIPVAMSVRNFPSIILKRYRNHFKWYQLVMFTVSCDYIHVFCYKWGYSGSGTVNMDGPNGYGGCWTGAIHVCVLFTLVR